MGGGSLMTPILILLFGFNAKVAGVLLGSSLSIKVPERSLRIVFGVVLVLSGIKVVGVPEANDVISAILGALLALLAGWLVRLARLRRVAAQEAA